MPETKYVPKRFVSSTPLAEVSGASMRSFVDNIQGNDIREIARHHHLDAVDPERWYPHQAVLEFYKELVSGVENVTQRLVAIGLGIINSAVMPPNISTVEEALSMIDVVYKLNHRYLDPLDCFTTFQIERHHLIIVDSTQYPDELHYGYLWSMVNRFKSKDSLFTVRIVENLRPEETPGTAFDIQWNTKR